MDQNRLPGTVRSVSETAPAAAAAAATATPPLPAIFSRNDSGVSDSQFFSGILSGAMASTADSVLLSKSLAITSQSLLIPSTDSSAFLLADQGHFDMSSSQILGEIAKTAEAEQYVQLHSEYTEGPGSTTNATMLVSTQVQQNVRSLTATSEMGLVSPSDHKNYPAPVPSDDGYNWRKYGQKQVKGTDYPRSYYKCSHPDCFMKKKVGRSPDGLVTEIIYKGLHNHEPPQQSRRAKESMVASGVKSQVLDGKDNERIIGIHGEPTSGGNNNVNLAEDHLDSHEEHSNLGSHFVRSDNLNKMVSHPLSVTESTNVLERAASGGNAGTNESFAGKASKGSQVHTVITGKRDSSVRSTGSNENLYGKTNETSQCQYIILYETDSSLALRDHDGQTTSPGPLSGSSEFDDEVDNQVAPNKQHDLEPLSLQKSMDSLLLDSTPTTPKTPREPRVIVESTIEKDNLDDGYRWRKYGQKIVKGNPNPRSYYKCTYMGCNVRKHVEKASHDSSVVVTTYEGKHNHDMPAAKNSNADVPVSSGVNSDKRLKSSKYAVIQQSSIKQLSSVHGEHEIAYQPIQDLRSNQSQTTGSKHQNSSQHPLNGSITSSTVAINDSSKSKSLSCSTSITKDLCPLPVMTNHALSIGQEFADAKNCRRAIKEIAIALRFDFKTVKSNPTCFTAKCSKEGCPWRVHASKLPCGPSFTIRTLKGVHTCGGIGNLNHKQASVDWVASVVEQRLRENPRYKPKEIVQDILQEHGIAISYKQAYRGKERSMENIYGSYEGGYRLLNVYCKQIGNSNPGSVAQVFTNPTDNCFQRLFVAIHASIYGFVNACRPLLGIDGARLKGKYFGVIFSATAVDAEGGLFPLAFGVVDVESNENWMWFLSELHKLLEQHMESIPMLTILSNRQKNVVEGVAAHFPSAFHGFYLRHLSENIKKKFGNKALVRLFLNAAYSLTITDFQGNMSKIEEISMEAAQWIRQISPQLWATSYVEGAQFGHLTSNMVEQFNSWVLEARDLPIVQLIDHIHEGLINRFQKRLQESVAWTSMFVPSIEKRLSETLSYAHRCQVFQANEAEFEVLSTQGTHGVNICDRYCSCRGWQIYGIPCTHAVAALLSCHQDVHQFVNKCFTAENYRKAYSEPVQPIPDKSLWMRSSDGGDKRSFDGDDMIVHPPLSRPTSGLPPQKKMKTKDRP